MFNFNSEKTPVLYLCNDAKKPEPKEKIFPFPGVDVWRLLVSDSGENLKDSILNSVMLLRKFAGRGGRDVYLHANVKNGFVWNLKKLQRDNMPGMRIELLDYDETGQKLEIWPERNIENGRIDIDLGKLKKNSKPIIFMRHYQDDAIAANDQFDLPGEKVIFPIDLGGDKADIMMNLGRVVAAVSELLKAVPASEPVYITGRVNFAAVWILRDEVCRRWNGGRVRWLQFDQDKYSLWPEL